MFKIIERPAACEMQPVIHFLNARNVQPADIHRQFCEVYGENAMSDSVVRRWARNFNEGRENMHDEQRSDRTSVVNDDLMRSVEENVRENRRLTISSLSLHFLHISRSHLHEMLSDRLEFRKLCSRWVPKMLGLTLPPKLKTFGWEQIDRPPYSPDLAPSDIHAFLHLKKFLGGRRFLEDYDVKDAVNTRFSSQAALLYDAGIQKLVPRYDKCLSNGGNYVEN
jgi:hypothetical protein